MRESVMNVILPMLSTTGGTLIMLSTPSGQEGLFFDAWQSGEWEKVKVTADQCPRISDEFLLDARRKLGDFGYRQEYQCEFLQGNQSYFNSEDIQAAFDMAEEDDEETEDFE